MRLAEEIESEEIEFQAGQTSEPRQAEPPKAKRRKGWAWCHDHIFKVDRSLG